MTESESEHDADRRATRVALAVAVLAAIGTLGAAGMAVGHMGFDVPLLSRLAPGPGRAIPPVAAGFVVGTLLYATLTAGAALRRRWAWPLGTVVNALAFASAAVPFRGTFSAVAMAVSGLALAVLLSPAGRAAFLDQ